MRVAFTHQTMPRPTFFGCGPQSSSLFLRRYPPSSTVSVSLLLIKALKGGAGAREQCRDRRLLRHGSVRAAIYMTPLFPFLFHCHRDRPTNRERHDHDGPPRYRKDTILSNRHKRTFCFRPPPTILAVITSRKRCINAYFCAVLMNCTEKIALPMK